MVAGFAGKYDKNLTNVTPHKFFLWDETKKFQRRKPPNLMRKELIWFGVNLKKKCGFVSWIVLPNPVETKKISVLVRAPAPIWKGVTSTLVQQLSSGEYQPVLCMDIV